MCSPFLHLQPLRCRYRPHPLGALVLTENPFATEWRTPFGSVPFDRIEVAHLPETLDRAMRIQRETIDRIAEGSEPPTVANTLDPLERSGADLRRARAVLSIHVSNVSNDVVRDIQRRYAGPLAAHESAIFQNQRLFGLQFIETADMTVWHPDVRVFECSTHLVGGPRCGRLCCIRGNGRHLRPGDRRPSAALRLQRRRYTRLDDRLHLVPRCPAIRSSPAEEPRTRRAGDSSRFDWKSTSAFDSGQPLPGPIVGSPSAQPVALFIIGRRNPAARISRHERCNSKDPHPAGRMRSTCQRPPTSAEVPHRVLRAS